MTNVIGLCGLAGAGKSVAADALETLGYERVKFSMFLKDMLRAFFRACGLAETEIERRIEGDLKETPDVLLGGKTPRYAMQTLGTDWGRELIAKDIWSMAWRAKAESALAAGGKIVAEDVRFGTEDSEVHRLGGNVVRMFRPDGVLNVGGHASEMFEDVNPDLTIINNGTIEELREKVIDLFGEPDARKVAA